MEDAGIPGIEESRPIWKPSRKPELVLHARPRCCQAIWRGTADVAMSLRTALFGQGGVEVQEGEDDYPAAMRFEDDRRYSGSALLNARITFRDQATGKISQECPCRRLAGLDCTLPLTEASNAWGTDRVITAYSNVRWRCMWAQCGNEIASLVKRRLEALICRKALLT